MLAWAEDIDSHEVVTDGTLMDEAADVALSRVDRGGFIPLPSRKSDVLLGSMLAPLGWPPSAAAAAVEEEAAAAASQPNDELERAVVAAVQRSRQ